MKPVRFPATKQPAPSTVLVLDLDETLVHSEFMHPSQVAYMPGMPHWHYHWLRHGITGYLRPGIREFLDFVQKRFTHVGVWTAAQPEYARFIVDRVLMPLGFHPKFLLTSNDCSLVQNQLVKPLEKLWTNPRYSWLNATPRNTVVIDDRPQTAVYNQNQLFQISPFIPRTPSDFESIDLFNMTLKLNSWLDRHSSSAKPWPITGTAILNILSRSNFPRPYPRH